MIGENIRRARKEKGLSQEELAVSLHVVRQTVSKWENNLSVPDADVLLRMAERLDVPLDRLLGSGGPPAPERDLAGELARLNEELAARIQREKQTERANRKRGLILFLAFLALLLSLAVKNEVLSLLLTGGCVLAALGILYRNLALLSDTAAREQKLPVLRAVTLFDMGVVAAAIAAVFLIRTERVALSENGEKLLVMALLAGIMLFAGFLSPRLPFNRHTGLRLPWTVGDEDTWNVAHRVLGIISLPIVLLYLAAAWTLSDFGAVTLAAVALWVGIPSGMSLVFYWKKMHGKL